uniref:DUF1758 domain-containing protein n=1 Tax=Steinernema glaseri TaxID=37863 RepID=A0A1I7XY45_9BILA
MSAITRSEKGLITRWEKPAHAVIQRFQDKLQIFTSTQDEDEHRTTQEELSKGLDELDNAKTVMTERMHKYRDAFSNLESDERSKDQASFESYMDKAEDIIDEIDKFAHLSTSLSGSAKETISRYITDDCYEDAYERLKKRFGNKHTLGLELSRGFQNLRTPGDNIQDMRSFVDNASAICSQLKSLDINPNHINNAEAIMEKLPQEIYDKTMQILPLNKLSDVELILEILDDVVEKVYVAFGRRQTSPQGHWTQTVNNSFGNQSASNTNFISPIRMPACVYCNQLDHTTFTCPLTAGQKRAILQQDNRCLNCTRFGHTQALCQVGGCRKCGQKHHTSICEDGQANQMTPCNNETRRFTNVATGGNNTIIGRPATSTPIQPQTVQHNASTPTSSHTLANNQIHNNHVHTMATSIAEVDGQQDEKLDEKIITGQLMTVKAQVLNRDTNTFEDIIAVLDSGSEISLISNQTADRLGLRKKKDVELAFVLAEGHAQPKKRREVHDVELRDNDGNRFAIEALQSERAVMGQLQPKKLIDDDKRALTEKAIQLSDDGEDRRENGSNCHPGLL